MSVDLDAIEARVAAAREGPWVWQDPGLGKVKLALTGPGFKGGPVLYTALGDVWPSVADAEFIAHARTDIPALVAEVRRLREILERVARANDLVETSADEIIAVYDGEP